jgi:FHS family L-fucose permease-like MFS transporter
MMEALDAPDARVGDRLFRLLIGVYLGGGLLNSIVNLLVPRLRATLDLNYAQALCIHLAYYSSYLLFALPITIGSVRIGYMRAIAVGLAVTAAGCLAFIAAQGLRDFPLILLSLLVMSAGVTFLQIAGNAVTVTFGPASRMASRFTLLQAFNSFGTVLGPLIGAWFLLGHDGRRSPELPFLLGSVGMLALATTFFFHRRLLPVEVSNPISRPRFRALLAQRRMQAGIAAIFVYVGAEVTIGTLAVSYLMLNDTAGLSALTAGRLVSLYWAGAMTGRIAGAFVVRRIGAAPLLCAACVGAMLLLATAVVVRGEAGAVALLAIGLCHSVMFPLVFALALPEDTGDVPIASMLLCMAVVGGAVVPVVTGITADAIGLVPSLLVPGLCYGVILAFGLSRRRIAQGTA